MIQKLDLRHYFFFYGKICKILEKSLIKMYTKIHLFFMHAFHFNSTLLISFEDLIKVWSHLKKKYYSYAEILSIINDN